jgi:RNA polymerase sigma-70 factor (ECF subfamily)
MEKNYEFKTDEQIVKQVLLGGTDSFRIIIERYQKKIFCIGLRFYNNDDDSYDFVQEVFIKAFENLGSYAGKAPFRFWLTKIAYNHAINKVNAKRVEEVSIPEQVPSRDTTPEEKHLHGELHGILLAAVRQLPIQYRICVDLYFFLGLKYNEISQITGYPVNTIKSNVLRAKKMLRDELKGTIAEDYHEM